MTGVLPTRIPPDRKGCLVVSAPGTDSPTLTAILPTYRRPEQLRRTLRVIFGGTIAPDALIVVDNGRQENTSEILREANSQQPLVTPQLLRPSENLGSAGGWAFGMRHVLDQLRPHDWILVLDDDDPPRSGTEVEQMWHFAIEQHALDPAVAAVGIVGARFDWRRGMLCRLNDDEIVGSVDVDYVGSGHVAMYRVSALREVGVFRDELFFGHTEVEFGLRLRGAGYRVVANGELWKLRRKLAGRNGIRLSPKWLCEVSSRRYYVIRNHVYMMRRFGRWDLALKYALVQTGLKPLLTLCHQPLLAVRGFLQGLRASRDGLLGRMGRRFDPTPTSTSEAKGRGSEGYTD